MHNKSLPDDLIQGIKNMACARKCNGETSSNELILTFGLTKSAKLVQEDGTLLKWLLRCLDRISDYVFDGHRYHWNVITQVAFSNFDNSEPDCPSSLLNQIVVAVHLDDDRDNMSYADDDLMLIPFQYDPTHKLTPQTILDCLIGEPIFVNRIGVSSVTSEVMMDWWADMISTNPSSMDEKGEGYMEHPMWIKLTDEQYGGDTCGTYGTWISVREKSFGFGWRNYRQVVGPS